MKLHFALHSIINADYYDGSIAYDDCALEPYSPFARLSDLVAAGDGAPATVSGKVVTAGLDGFFYVEEADRSSGIRVTGTASAGDTVFVRGRLDTVNGERTLISDPGGVAAVPGGFVPAPLGMNNRTAGAAMVTGLYATVWGRVLSMDTAGNCFTISDGSPAPLKVYGAPGAAGYVRVTGPVGAELAAGARRPVVHAVSVRPED